MGATDISRFLPNNEYQAAINANNPSAANPFATLADIGGAVTTLYSGDDDLAGDRTVNGTVSNHNLNFINLGGFSITGNGNGTISSNTNLNLTSANTVDLDAPNVNLVKGKINFQKSGWNGLLDWTAATSDRTFTLQDASGTLAFLSDIPAPSGDGIYDGSGTVPTTTVATLTDTINFNGGKVGIGIAPIAQLSVKALSNGIDQAFTVRDNTDSFDLMTVLGNGNVGVGNPTIAARLHVKGADESVAFRVDTDNINNMVYVAELTEGNGFFGVNTTSQLTNERFRVQGNVVVGTVLNTGNVVTSSSNGINMPDTHNIAIGGTARLTSLAGGATVLDAGTNSEVHFRDTSNRTYGFFDIGKFEITAAPATSGATIKNEEFNILSQYWDGAATQTKEFSVLHNITAAPSGSSQVEMSIGGTDILTLLDTGVAKVNGDAETVGSTKGYIVEDRTDGNRYRIYTDNGVLYTEVVV